jgi:hypothetical protein
MRNLRIGDKVQAFWDANIAGKVIKLYMKKSNSRLTENGPSNNELLWCKIELDKNSDVVKIPANEVFITEH